MKKIPEILVREMRKDLEKKSISREEQVDWFKWLRYYLDFCEKYRHSTRDPETEILYLPALKLKPELPGRDHKFKCSP